MDQHEFFTEAIGHHRAGRLAEAERLYRQVLVIDARHADALHLLGVLAGQVGRNDIAADLIAQAIGVDGQSSDFRVNLGNALLMQGRLAAAAQAFSSALVLSPALADAWHNRGLALQGSGSWVAAADSFGRALACRPDHADAAHARGNALQTMGRSEEAVSAYLRALDSRPDLTEAHVNLGAALQDLGRAKDAAAAYRRALTMRPDLAAAHFNLGNALHTLDQLAGAAEAYGRAVACQPDYVAAIGNLGNVLKEQGRLGSAVATYRRALAVRPDHVDSLSNLGLTLQVQWRLTDAVRCFRRALAFQPDHAPSLSNLGVALLEQGRVEEAVSAFARALACRPGYAEAELNLIVGQLYQPHIGLADLLARSRQWDEVHAAEFRGRWPAHRRPDGTHRRPRLGFVSADFRQHPVGLLALPALEGLARAGWHLTCYSNSNDNSFREDRLRRRFTRAANRWRSVAFLSDEELAALIEADGIDILVDLSGYSAGNRLLALARKPAPIQVAGWLGYPATSGMAAMDYVLADRFQIPPGTERFYSEAVVRLPNGYAAFEPAPDAPVPGELPALQLGYVTFGSFNAMKKISAEVIALWSRILCRLPDSRLLMKTLALDCPETRRQCVAAFVAQGIAADRLDLIGRTRPEEHMAWMAKADVALDPFPYAGGQTALEALWMGLPVICLPRETFASRHSLGYLSTIGLGEFAAADRNGYVETAVALATDLPRLASLRSGLRSRMRASPLCDADRFAEGLGRAFSIMWRRWSDGEAAGPFDLT